MRPSDAEQVRKLRSALTKARAENSRMMAAAIGAHLRRITAAAENPGVVQASERVKDATLQLLTSLHSQGDIATTRVAALESLDRLEGSLEPQDLRPGPLASPQHLTPPKRGGLLGRFTRRPADADG
jgi:hypothetical protein